MTEEMKTNLMRTAYNIIIYEALDFTTGLFTPDGDTVSIGIGLPMFIRGLAETMKAKLRRFGTANIHPVTSAHQRHSISRAASEPRDAYAADLPRRRAGGVLLLHGALARHWRTCSAA